MTARVHIVGASGAGTTTLGLALARRLGCPHLDTDDFFWLPSEPDYQFIRPRDERQALLGEALAREAAWVLSGSLCGWGDVFIPQFDLVVFLLLPPELRLARLRQRERWRYGAAIEPGGPRHERYVEFVAWAASYDDGVDVADRCRLMHEQWLAALPGPVLRLEGPATVEDNVARVLESVGSLGGSR